ncbi:MAG TPA: DUF255 domain-containing protein [Vicinamibacteria bacterium]|nr:DUF255 domain-containing protein [Vicinamibacteria bacterium]
MPSSTLALLFSISTVACSRSQEPPPGTNRLIHESSPYLLLHARNPVDWYPWGEEAIARARELDRPIFLSVGYSTCYWCYRMEDDVFENPEIAALMNEGFVSIKVDREERPDLDEIYMTATQLMTRRGGWPNSVFLTPDLEPFFAGTYFPPEDRGQAVGFPTVLRRIREMWDSDRDRIEESAERIAEAIREMVSSAAEPSAELPELASVEKGYEQLASGFDGEWGGFSPAPKFPTPSDLFLLLAEAKRGNDQASHMLLTTLHRMGEGALYDHLAGGFHRYATDREWRIPHFEKMLYDNAALAEIYLEAAAIAEDQELARRARGTLEFVLQEMTGAEGGFLSAIDAQTDGKEGAYYVFSKEELDAALTDDELSLIGPIFGFDSEPNFEGHLYTLYLTAPLKEHTERLGISRERLLERMEPALEKLRVIRRQRKFPLVDDKILTDWNGMMIAAMAKGAPLLEEPRYERAAKRAARFVVDELRASDGKLLHAWRDGVAKIPAFLDDYAFLMKGLVALHRTTGETAWLETAEGLAEEMESRLRDPKGGYYQSPPEPLLLVQSKSALDGAIPSGNGIAVEALLDLAELTGKAVYRERAEAAMRAFANELETYPAAAKTLALSVERLHRERPESLATRLVRTRIEPEEPRSGWRRFRLELDIEPGWHVNANPASSSYLIPTELKGEVRGVMYPPGKEVTFSFSDEAVSVYDGTVSLAGELGADASSVTLVYQACDDTRCLAPVEKVLTLR